MSVFTWIPEYNASVDTKPGVIKAKFGDGYEQRIVNGINSKTREWTLSFMKSTSDIDSIESFLNTAAGATSFTWTPPRGAIGKWVCDTWKRGIPNPAYDTLTCTFREVFGE